MIKRLNKDKRAQDLSITTLVLIVLGVIVLVFIAIVITQGFDVVLKALGLAPSNVAGMVEKCVIFGGQTTITSAETTYCEVERKINTDRYGKINVNCEYTEIRRAVFKDNLYGNGPYDCYQKENDFCIGETQKNGKQIIVPDTVKVNWYTCADVFASAGNYADIYIKEAQVIPPPVVTGSCVPSMTSEECYNHINDQQNCVAAGCKWDTAQESKCIVKSDCGSQTATTTCTAVSGCEWT